MKRISIIISLLGLGLLTASVSQVSAQLPKINPIIGIDGGGTAGFLAKFLDPNTIGDSIIYELGGNVGIGTTNPGQKLTVSGTIESTSGGVKFPDGTTQITVGSVLQTRVYSDYTRRVTSSGNSYYFGGGEYGNAITPKKSNSVILINISYFGEADTHDVHTFLQYSIGGGAWTDFDVVGNGQQGTLKLGSYPDADYNSTPHNYSTQVAKAFGTTQAIAFRMWHFNGGTFYHNNSVSTPYETGPSTLVLQELDAQNSSYVKR